MEFKFIINPAVYIVMLSLEVIGMYLVTKIFTKIEADRKRLIIGTVVVIIFIFILDSMVFKYHKNGIRSLLIMSTIFVYLKLINQISWFKALKQILVMFVVLLIVDTSVQLITRGLLINSAEWLFGNFSYMYAIYLAILYMIIAIVSILNIKVFDFN